MADDYKIAFGTIVKTGSPAPVDQALTFEWEAEASATPYYLQGDESMYTAENIARRKRLKKDLRVQQSINEIWLVLEKTESDTLTKAQYVSLFSAICSTLNPSFTPEQIRTAVNADWQRDCYGQEEMTHEQFFQSLFELADIWCADVDGSSYANFLEKLYKRITQE